MLGLVGLQDQVIISLSAYPFLGIGGNEMCETCDRRRMEFRRRISKCEANYGGLGPDDIPDEQLDCLELVRDCKFRSDTGELEPLGWLLFMVREPDGAQCTCSLTAPAPD